MESGLEDRNNRVCLGMLAPALHVKIDSGLEDRNNEDVGHFLISRNLGLNGVRPRRPEQCRRPGIQAGHHPVSMESGLEDRNNRQDAT